MKTRYFILGAILVLFILAFFFNIIPIPLEDSSGSHGGLIFTSLYQQLSLKNFIAFFSGISMFGVLFVGMIMLNRKWE